MGLQPLPLRGGGGQDLGKGWDYRASSWVIGGERGACGFWGDKEGEGGDLGDIITGMFYV